MKIMNYPSAGAESAGCFSHLFIYAAECRDDKPHHQRQNKNGLSDNYQGGREHELKHPQRPRVGEDEKNEQAHQYSR